MTSQCKTYSIELDCAPMMARPSAFLPWVLKGTGIKLDAQKPDSTFFGNWAWEIPAAQVAKYEKVRDTIEKRVTELYNEGNIRYGSW